MPESKKATLERGREERGEDGAEAGRGNTSKGDRLRGRLFQRERGRKVIGEAQAPSAQTPRIKATRD